MGKRKRWRKYHVGEFRLGQVKGEAIAFWYDEKGKKHRAKLGVRSETAGQRALDQFARETKFQIDNPDITVGEIFEQYVIDRQREGKKIPTMLESWRNLAPRFANMPHHLIDTDMCRAYARERFALGRRPSTVWTELLRLRTALNWAEKRDVIKKAPYVWLCQKSPPRDRTLTESELLNFMEAVKYRHTRLFFILAFTTGARTGAILELTWDRVDFEEMSIDLRAPRTMDPMEKRTEKGRSIVHMNNLARAALTEARGDAKCDYVIEWNGKPIKSIKKSFARVCRDAGLKGVTPHTLRHTAATLQLEADIPIEKIARYLGHKDSRVTSQIYAKTTPSYLKDASKAVDLDLEREKRVGNAV